MASVRRIRRELEADFEQLARDGFCADPAEIARDGLGLLTPPERISVTDCAAKHRLIPNSQGGARLWSATLMPYINEIQNGVEAEDRKSTAVVGPARSGKTMGAENVLFKRMKFGPVTDVLWYVPPALVDDYIDTTVTPLFDLHPDVAAKVGRGKSDNKRNLKRFAGKFLLWLAAQQAKFVGKQAPLIVVDEIDILPKKLRSNIRQQISFRQRAFGVAGRSYLCSHPDAGYVDGIAAIWLESTRGMWFWPCPHCSQWSSPCPKADWRMRLTFERPKGMAEAETLDHVRDKAGMLCPHCGSVIGNDSKVAMNAAGKWVHDGQTIALDGTVTGQIRPNDTFGYWIHGTMSPLVSWGQLARDLVSAQLYFERTGKSDRLKEETCKAMGEVYEGPTGRKVDAKRLRERMDAGQALAPDDPRHKVGEVPPWVRFITAAVDVGGNKFDTAFWGWGADRECALIQRETLTAALSGEKLQPPLVQAHWDMLKARVLGIKFPIKGRPGWYLGVALMTYDTNGAPGTTDQAKEFARRMMLDPASGQNGYRVRPIRGAQRKTAPEIGVPREVNRDAAGRPIEPSIYVTDLGVFELKKTISERLGVDAPGPGYIHLPVGGDPAWADELTNETMVDNEFVRNGPNETFDLLVYGEAARQMLKPDRAEIDWDSRPPPWARPEKLAAMPDTNTIAVPAPPLTPEKARAEKREKLLKRIAR